MGKLQQIEFELISINDAVFQDLCDDYISATEPDCHTKIHRSGSVAGKQKSKKGTPDSYYTVSNGNYVLCQYTTQASEPKAALLKKIREDIDACADKRKTGIDINEVERIIYCLNSVLHLKEHSELKNHARSKGFNLDIISLSQLALGIMQTAPQLATDYLGLALDSGQILPVSNFIDLYERSGHATPLSNSYIDRLKEMEELEQAIAQNSVTIVTGAPGVGKTKLVMELFKLFKERQFQIYCVDNRDVPIFNDLQTYIRTDENYILFIDDANRQTGNMRQILQLLRESRTGELHIVITVRDYALEQIETHAEWTKPAVVRIEKFNDEQIKALLASADFNINHKDYVNRILEIADGNPRLAIMAARVAIKEQRVEALHDVSEVYDQYFGAAIDQELFKSKDLLQALGVVSFFYAINKSDEPFYSKMLRNFGLDRYVFEESLVRLEQLELVESSPDFSIVHIADQVLGTYFFYRVFFKLPVVSFTVVLDHYFFSHHSRVRDTVVPANNTFAYSNMLEKIDPFLTPFWLTVKDEAEKANKFLEIFWAYRQEEALQFVYHAVQQTPEEDSPHYIFDRHKNRHGHHTQDMYLGVLRNFYQEAWEKIGPVLELGAMYVSRKPHLYQEWVEELRDSFTFTHTDARYGYYRQEQLVNFLVAVKTPDEINTIRLSLFFDLGPHLMKTSFQVVSGGRKRNTISFGRYDILLSEYIKKIRVAIWIRLQELFATDKERSIEFLRQYLERTIDKVKQLYAFDLPFVLSIVRRFLKPKMFSHCMIVQNFISWFTRMGIKDDRFEQLKIMYHSKTYNVYEMLSFNYLKHRAEEMTRIPYDQFNKRKEREIRSNFIFADVNEFKKFYKQYLEIDANLDPHSNHFKLSQSFDIVIDEAFSSKAKNGFSFIKHLITTGNQSTIVPWLFCQRMAKDKKLYKQCYTLINNHEFQQKDRWLYNWFRFLPDEQATTDLAEDVKNLFTTAQKSLYYFDFDHFQKFERICPGFNEAMLEIIYKKNEALQLHINIRELVSEHLSKFKHNLPLLKKAYLQQQKMADHYDHNFHDLVEILKLDPDFIIEYLQYWSKGPYMSIREHKGMSYLWSLPNAAAILRKACDWISEKIIYDFGDDFATVFFKDMSAERKADAKEFLWEYLKENISSARIVDMVLDCARSCFPEEFEPMLLYFLRVEPSFAVFEKLNWTQRMMLVNGDTITGDVRAAQYQKVMDILDKITDKIYLYTEHKTFIRDSIRSEKRYGDQERRRKFYDKDW